MKKINLSESLWVEKYNNVKEIVDELAEDVKMRQSFEEKIMNSYPDLFYKDSDGKPIPPSCGISCPVGWEHLVENLCLSIDHYVKNSEITTQKHKVWFKIKKYLYCKIIVPIHNVLYNIVDPYKQYRTEADKKYKAYIVRPEIDKMVKEKHPRRLKLAQNISLFFHYFRPYYKWNKKPIPQVKIAQIKEKFGSLRFYYDGGDDIVSGMVRFAERLSDRTCEESGATGSLSKKNGWWRTLSPKMAKKFGYVLVKPSVETI